MLRERISKTLILTSIFILIFFLLGPLAPINEPVYGYSGNSLVYIGVPVYLSFSAFLAVISFIISAILFWGSKRAILNYLVDSLGFSAIFLNYLNFLSVYETWRPEMYVIPFFIVVVYHNYGTTVASMSFDWGQFIALVLAVKYILEWRRGKTKAEANG